MRFNIIKGEIERLCKLYGLDTPVIKLARITDKCDVTKFAEIRINLNQEVKDMYHARHVFGHWIGDLHSINPDTADKVADIIAQMINETKGD